MRKLLFYSVLCLIVFLGGCGQSDEAVTYVTKYITNTQTTDMRENPSNSSSMICSLNYGEAVSFVKDVENGYSEVIYDGAKGYILSVYLTAEKPEMNTSAPIPPAPPQKPAADSNPDLVSSRSESEIEDYISSFVRPLYNDINGSLDNYSVTTSGAATLWYDSQGLVKKEIPEGKDGYNMSRQYYYDTESGQIVFAFVFKGTQEHRLYFKSNQLIRYIDASGNIYNNPTDSEALSMAAHAVSEAY